jgi:hypothetical protein
MYIKTTLFARLNCMARNTDIKQVLGNEKIHTFVPVLSLSEN